MPVLSLNADFFICRLQRFEKTNEMLLNCNALSASRLKTAGEDFKKHTKLLSEMKKDLDYIFKKIRIIKAKVSVQYPDAYTAAQPSSKNSFAEEAEDDFEVTVGVAAHEKDTHKNEQVAGPSMSTGATPKPLKLLEKKKSLSGNKISIDYVQMEQSPSDNNDRLNVNVCAKRRSLESNRSTSTENSNDSSDCTSDTN